MNSSAIDQELVVSFFAKQPQPAFWMTPVWGEDQQIVDFEYSYCNEEFYNYTGLERTKVLGNRLFNSPAIADDNYRRKLFQEILDVYYNGHRTQSWLYNTHLNKYYSYTRNKVEGGVLTVLQDRTEEYRMMQQLEEQKNLMDNILQHSSNAISVGEMIRNEEGKIVDIRTILVNDAAVRYTGLPREQYLSKTGIELDPSFATSEYFKQCVDCMETGKPFLTQYYLEGVHRWMEVSVSKMDENRQIYIFTDVTSIKEAQLALERSAKQLQEIISRTQSGIFTAAPVFDEEGTVTDFRFVMVNNTLAAYLNQQPESLTGELGSRWFTGYKKNGLFEVFCDTYLHHTVNRFDFHYHADGIDAWIDLMCTRFDGEILVTFTDYTPAKKMQLEMEALVKELQRSNANLEEFAHAASHDLKEPIRKILTFASRLKDRLQGRMDDLEGNMFARMESGAERMAQLVEDLLQYSKLSTNTSQLEEVDLKERLQQVLTDLEVQIEEKSAMITIGSLPVVQGYGRQLQQLFQNLVSNALKYSQPEVPPQIHISAGTVAAKDVPRPLSEQQQRVLYHLLEVRDNGIGFEQQYAERIFQMFQRLHGRSEYAGTGVGLSIARKVVDNHGGFIMAESEPGKGSTFKVYLPVESPGTKNA
jgi:signal transduction histidine kinase